MFKLLEILLLSTFHTTFMMCEHQAIYVLIYWLLLNYSHLLKASKSFKFTFFLEESKLHFVMKKQFICILRAAVKCQCWKNIALYLRNEFIHRIVSTQNNGGGVHMKFLINFPNQMLCFKPYSSWCVTDCNFFFLVKNESINWNLKKEFSRNFRLMKKFNQKKYIENHIKHTHAQWQRNI